MNMSIHITKGQTSYFIADRGTDNVSKYRLIDNSRRVGIAFYGEVFLSRAVSLKKEGL